LTQASRHRQMASGRVCRAQSRRRPTDHSDPPPPTVGASTPSRQLTARDLLSGPGTTSDSRSANPSPVISHRRTSSQSGGSPLPGIISFGPFMLCGAVLAALACAPVTRPATPSHRWDRLGHLGLSVAKYPRKPSFVSRMHNSHHQVPTAHPPRASSLQFPHGNDCSSSLASRTAAIQPALGLESLPGRAPPILLGQTNGLSVLKRTLRSCWA